MEQQASATPGGAQDPKSPEPPRGDLVLWDILDQISATCEGSDPDLIARSGAELLAHLAGARRASVYHSEDDGGFRRLAASGPGAEERPLVIPGNPSPGGALMRHAQALGDGPVFIDDVVTYRQSHGIPISCPGGEEGGCILLPMRSGHRRMGVLNLAGLASRATTLDLPRCRALGHGVRLLGLAIDRTRNEQRLRDAATRDGLTGLYNQASFREKLAEEVERSTRYQLPLSLILIDVDHFKKVNDTHGHLEGDRVLVHVARQIDGARRASDHAARNGGDEFALVLPQTGMEGALSVAERIQSRVRSGRDCPTTVSIGVATLTTDMSDEDLVSLADRRLYAAKDRGRECIVGT